MQLTRVGTVLSLAAIVTWLVVPAWAQGRATTVHDGFMPRINPTGKTDWPLHNLDLRNSRFSPLNEINQSNASNLTVKWSFQGAAGETFGEITPLVVDGVMYFNAGYKLFAVNAVTGASIWTLQMESESPSGGTGPATGGGRGPAYGDGKVYAFGPSIMYAVDAKTGELVDSFGDKGRLRIVNRALESKYPGKYPANLDPRSLGYSMTNPPTYHNGTLYAGFPFSDSHLPGGLVVAADGTTGAVKWVFNTIPQGPQDDGWDIVKNTWGSGARAGGGVWTQPAIDPELGMIYFNVGNPSPDYDGSPRKGINLFTNSTVALNLATGKLAWYYQAVHHDIWDWDLPTGPVLFDVTVGGKTIKGIGAASKTCYWYLWNRETGQPINPIVETAVPTKTDVPGEEVWPTQPIPYTSRGVPQQPICSTYPIIADPELAKRVRPTFHPPLANEFVIIAPGVAGGPNFGPPSFSPRTGLVYVTAKNDAFSIKVKPVGDTIRPGPTSTGYLGSIAARGETGIKPTTSLTGYDPATGQQVWYSELRGPTNSGNLVTAGDVIFQGIGTGDFYGLDARSGRELFRFTAKTGIRASPLTYQVDGKQYVSVVATNTVLTFGLP